MADSLRKTNVAKVSETPMVAGWRFKFGVALFALSLFGPLVLIPIVAALGLPGAMVASITGGILVGVEVVLVLAAAVMGKSGCAYIRNRVFGFVKRHGPPQEVGQTRYYIGLALFIVPIFFGWLAPYLGTMISAYDENAITYAIIGDLLLLVSLFILGGNFWDKLRALFIHDAKVAFP
jgi:hypothetical protein